MNEFIYPVMTGLLTIFVIYLAVKRLQCLNEIAELKDRLDRSDRSNDTLRIQYGTLDKSNDILRNDLELALIASGKSRYDFLLGIEAVRIEKKCGGKK